MNHVLYRMYGPVDEILYIGVTDDPPARFKGHRHIQRWWNQVCTIKLDRYMTREELEAAEREAIASEAPLYNFQQNPVRRFNVENCRAQGHTPRSKTRRCAKCDADAFSLQRRSA